MMEVKHLLRPARLVQKWPAARPIINNFKSAFDVNCICKYDAAVQVQKDLQAIYNEWVDGMPKSDRNGIHTILFDLLDEVSRIACWARFDRQTFLIGAKVQAELMRSASGDVRVDDLNLPYPCVFVGFESPGPAIGSSCLEGLLIRQSPDNIAVTLCAAPIPSQKEWDIDPAFTVEMQRGKDWTITEAFQHYSDELYQRVAEFEVALGDTVSSAKIDGVSIRAIAKTSARLQADEFSEISVDLVEATQFAANVLCLLASPHESLLSRSEWFPAQNLPVGKKHKKEAFQAGALEVRWLNFDAKHSEGTGTASAVREHGPRAHWRRGHFRRQPYGSQGNVTYRPKWIRPVLVNPESGPAAERSEYIVGGHI